MATVKQLLTDALNGGTPERTPLSFYTWMDTIKKDGKFLPQWQRLFDMGLGGCHHVYVTKNIEHGVKSSVEEKVVGGQKHVIHRKETPVGTIEQLYVDGWHTEYWIKTNEDYKTYTWIVENTEIVPDYDAFHEGEEFIGDYGVPVILASRTPAMHVNVDLAGTEKFCMDVALEVPELMELYNALKVKFIEETAIVAKAPGRFVKWLENLTISMLGPDRYNELLVPLYDECVPVMEEGGKRVMVHYDGALSIIKDHIAKAPFHMIESLTEPPEGNMHYDECRAAWPEKVFWANINVEHYYKPKDELKEIVKAKRERAGKKALAFEISEDLPKNWQESIPVVLEALEELG